MIAVRTGSRFAFVRTRQLPVLDSLLQQDEHFRELARDSLSAVYEVLDASRR